jgi:HK97 family phage major capsid protein
MANEPVVITNEALATAVAEYAKEQGLDKVDRKHGVFPDTKPAEMELTKEQRFTNWFRAICRRDFSDPLVRATLVEGSDSGSYVIPVEYATEVAMVLGNESKARRYCRVINLGSSSMKIPDLTAHVSVTIPGENTAFSESIPTVLQKTLTLKVIGAISPLSNELIADNNVNLLSVLAQSYGEALADFENDGVFGDASSFGTALLKLATGVEVPMVSSSIANVTADDLQALRRAVNERYWRNAKFFAHPYVISYLEQVKGNDGQYIVRQPNGGADVRSLWGHELVSVNGMPSADAADTEFIGFADPQFCWFGTQSGMQITPTEHATLSTAGNLFEKNLTAIRVTERVGSVWTNEPGTARLLTAAA